MTNTTNKTVGNGFEETRDALHQAGERIEQTTREARKVASEKLHSAAAAGRQQAGEAYDTAERLARSAGRYAKDHPGQAILIGLGGLLLAGMLFRRR